MQLELREVKPGVRELVRVEEAEVDEEVREKHEANECARDGRRCANEPGEYREGHGGAKRGAKRQLWRDGLGRARRCEWA